MNEVKRWYVSPRTIAIFQRADPNSEIPPDFSGLVLASDYDAMAQRYDELFNAYTSVCADGAHTANERDALRAEVERLQDSLGRQAQQIAALVADPNGWQAGYDKGRNDGTKFRLSELEQERSENAELRRIVSECARAAGAMVVVDCSLKFMAGVPAEIKSRCRSSPSSS